MMEEEHGDTTNLVDEETSGGKTSLATHIALVVVAVFMFLLFLYVGHVNGIVPVIRKVTIYRANGSDYSHEPFVNRDAIIDVLLNNMDLFQGTRKMLLKNFGVLSFHKVLYSWSNETLPVGHNSLLEDQNVTVTIVCQKNLTELKDERTNLLHFEDSSKPTAMFFQCPESQECCEFECCSVSTWTFEAAYIKIGAFLLLALLPGFLLVVTIRGLVLHLKECRAREIM